MLLSIIVPCYNVEDYVEECVNSLLHIEKFEYEIILINDGSTDSTYERILKYKGLPNVKIYSQKNRGLSATRNTGLIKSLGEYVFFCDSDDWIDANALANMLSLLKELNVQPDLIIGNYFEALESYNRKSSKCFEEVLSVDGKTILINSYIQILTSVVWRNLFRREFLLKYNLCFKEGVYFEDVEYMPRVLLKASDVLCTPYYFYFYRQRIGSIMNSSYNQKKWKDSIFICNEMIKYRTTNNQVNKIIDRIIGQVLFKAIKLSNEEISSNDLEQIKVIVKSIDTCPFKQKFFFSLFLLFPNFVRKALT